jgi:AcrR family transcriptional regulator
MPRIRAENIAEHKAQTRAEILRAAEELFRDFGYRETSLGDVAAKVGIGRTTLYEYFTDKEDIAVSLVEEELPKLLERLVESVPTEKPYPEQILHLARGMVEFVVTDATLGLILHRDIPKLSAQAQARVRDAHAEFARGFAAIYAAGVEAGELRAIPVDLAGRFLQDLIMSAARALIVNPDPWDRMDEVVSAMEEFLLHGLAVP